MLESDGEATSIAAAAESKRPGVLPGEEGKVGGEAGGTFSEDWGRGVSRVVGGGLAVGMEATSERG